MAFNKRSLLVIGFAAASVFMCSGARQAEADDKCIEPEKENTMPIDKALFPYRAAHAATMSYQCV